MKRNAFLLGFALANFSSVSAAQEFVPEMLFGSVITADFIEERTILSRGARLHQTVKSITQMTFSAGPTVEAIDKVIATVEGRAPNVQTYKTGKVPVGTPFKFRDGMTVFIFEGNQLKRLRTLGDGARMGTYEFSTKDGVLSCKASVGMLRENGAGQVKVDRSYNHSVLSSRMTASSCTVKKE